MKKRKKGDGCVVGYPYPSILHDWIIIASLCNSGLEIEIPPATPNTDGEEKKLLWSVEMIMMGQNREMAMAR